MVVLIWMEPAFLLGVAVRLRRWIVIYLGFVVVGIELRPSRDP